MHQLALLADPHRHVTGQQLGHGCGQGGRLVFVHSRGCGIRQLAGGGQMAGHAAQLVLGELKVAQRGAELLAFSGIAGADLQGSLSQAGCPSAGLEAPGGKAGHLQIKASVQPGFLADQVLGRHEILVAVQHIRVHAPVAQGRDGVAL